jgi:hypothetical protein
MCDIKSFVIEKFGFDLTLGFGHLSLFWYLALGFD